MSDREYREDESVVAGGTLRSRHFVIIVLLALAALTVYYWAGRREKAPSPPTSGVKEVPEGSRTVTLFFAGDDEPTLVTETRQVAIGKGFVEQAQQVLDALLAGPQRGGASTIPEGTRLLDVFFDSEAYTLYLDFSSELVAAHPGGSTAEYYTIAAIMKTVSENFPEVQAVQILVEGLQVGTIAGHINAYDALLVRDWR